MTEAPNIHRIHVEVHIDASPQATWRVLGDFGAPHHWIPALKSAHMEAGASPEVGATRVCEARGFGTVRETLLEWHDGQQFTYEARNVGLFSAARNRWTLRSDGEGASVVTSDAEMELRFGGFGRLLYWLWLRHVIRRMGRTTMQSLKRTVEAAG